MLMSSSTNVYASLGSIATNIITDFKVYIFIIVGVVFGFYIIERLITAIFPQKYYGEKQENDIQ
jgi:hypothetical protein